MLGALSEKAALDQGGFMRGAVAGVSGMLPIMHEQCDLPVRASDGFFEHLDGF